MNKDKLIEKFIIELQKSRKIIDADGEPWNYDDDLKVNQQESSNTNNQTLSRIKPSKIIPVS